MLSLGCLKFKYLIIRDISDKIRQDLHQFRQNPTKSDIHIDKFYMSIISSYGFPMKMTIRPKQSVDLDLGQPQDPIRPWMKAVAAHILACSTRGCYNLRPPPGGYILSLPLLPQKAATPATPLQAAPLLGSGPVLSRHIRCYRTPQQPLHHPQSVGSKVPEVVGSGVAPVAASGGVPGGEHPRSPGGWKHGSRGSRGII